MWAFPSRTLVWKKYHWRLGVSKAIQRINKYFPSNGYWEVTHFLLVVWIIFYIRKQRTPNCSFCSHCAVQNVANAEGFLNKRTCHISARLFSYSHSSFELINCGALNWARTATITDTLLFPRCVCKTRNLRADRLPLLHIRELLLKSLVTAHFLCKMLHSIVWWDSLSTNRVGSVSHHPCLRTNPYLSKPLFLIWHCRPPTFRAPT